MRALVALLLLTGTAAAEDFALLDRQDATDKLELDASYFTQRNVGQFTRLDAFGAKHFGGFGIYGDVPLVFESDMVGDTRGGIGDLELGVFFAAPSGVSLRAGVVLPTSTDENNGSGPVLSTLSSRLGDLVLALPNTTALRGGLSYEARRCAIFFRVDVGVDLLLDSTYGSQFGDQQIHLNAGIGFDAGDLELTASVLNELAIDANADALDAFAGEIRFRASDLTQLYLAIAVPVDGTRGQQTFAAVAGIAIR